MFESNYYRIESKVDASTIEGLFGFESNYYRIERLLYPDRQYTKASLNLTSED